ncbi:group III truncated hemoglobin [Permianibacter aggregans]|nr:group III truncated hemoglobin [Permianibacter aggregans]
MRHRSHAATQKDVQSLHLYIEGLSMTNACAATGNVLAEKLGRERVARIVHHFYARVREHPRLKVPFLQHVQDWPQHEAIISHFWWVMLGGEKYLDYRYALPSKHHEAGFTPELLQDWLALFNSTLADFLDDEDRAAWMVHAERIGQSLMHFHHHPPSALLLGNLAKEL